WLIEHRVIDGDPYRKETFEPLTAMLAETWQGEHVFQLAGLAIDSGYATNAVLGWARDVADPRVMVIKGDHHMNWSAMLGAPKKSDRLVDGRPVGVMVWPVGGALIKQETYGFLRLPVPLDGERYPAGYIRLPKAAAGVCKQLTAEDLVTRTDSHGLPKQEWAKNRDRNEALDCRVYARAVAEKLGMSRWTEADWERIRTQMLPRKQ